MSKEQIEEMVSIINNSDPFYECKGTPCRNCEFFTISKNCYVAKALYNAGYRKQIEGEWVKRLDEYDCEYAQCSCCKEDFYDATGEDTIDMFYNFCPNCGAHMKGGAE